MFGDKLKLARKKAGFSLRTLADVLEVEHRVSAQVIGKYEHGEMIPSSSVLIALSKALGEPVHFFMSSMSIELINVDFRKIAAANAKQSARVEAIVADKVERYLTIENILELDSARWICPLEPVLLQDIEESEELANRVREIWKLGGGPILDMTELLEKKGIKVIAVALPEKFYGMTCLVQHSASTALTPVIVVNCNHTIEQRRMTLAHELAHRMIDSNSSVDDEQAAMRYAGAFLMPAAHLIEEVGKHRHSLSYFELMELKQVYRVSAAALLGRLNQLGIITQPTYIYLFKTIARGWRTSEPLPINDELTEAGNRFQRLSYRALSENLISLSKATELIGANRSEIEGNFTRTVACSKNC